MTAGQGNDTLIGGAGSTTMIGGPDHDMFDFFSDPNSQVAGGNHATINGFVSGQDKIDLKNFSETTAQLFANATKAYDGGTVLHLSDGTTVTFNHTAITAAGVIRQ